MRSIVRHVDPLALPIVPAPDAPLGTRSVNVNNGSTVIVDRLPLNGNALLQQPLPAQ